MGLEKSITMSALAAGIKDSSTTAEMIEAVLSVDQGVNRIVFRIHVRFGREKAVRKRNWLTEEIKYLSKSGCFWLARENHEK
jgi:hypothetical protein